MKQSYFLVVDDDTADNQNPNRKTMWGKNRSQHIFTVESPEDQKVYISAHTWPTRSYPNDCRKDGPIASEHIVVVTGEANADSDRGGKWLYFSGSGYYAGFEMKAG
jgi:hypothetical protein